MNKILLLGGASQQVVAIQTAKQLGYYTILCDFLADNPGQFYADKFYLISTTDKDEVLNIAKKERISGVLAYASDPAAPTAAYVAEQLGLPGNPYKSVKILCNKDQFREFLLRNGFNAPKAKGYTLKERAIEELKLYRFPVIVKPVDSSGSKGATVLYNMDNAEEAVDSAFVFSRSRRIIVEEFIEKKHPYLIGGDVFVIKGRIVLWGLMNCHRDNKANPLVPVGKSYPLVLGEKDIKQVKKVLQKLVSDLHIENGALNVELVVDKNDLVWPIDVGPRSGGNMIPELLGYIYNINIPEMCIRVAMGEFNEFRIGDARPFFATHNLHTIQNGIYQGIDFSQELERYIIRKCFYKKRGDLVEFFDNAAKALGIIFMKFESEEQMYKILSNIDSYIKIYILCKD